MRRGLRITSLLLLLAGIALTGPALRAADVAARYDPTDAERARWTLADLRTLATALEAYRSNTGAYPSAGSLEEMIRLIEPMYVRKAPRVDAWGTPYVYLVSEDGSEYALASAGADGVYSPEAWDVAATSGDLQSDAVVRSGSLIRGWPYR